MQFVIPLILVSIFSLFISKHLFFRNALHVRFFVGAFLLKVFFSFSLLYLYSNIYTDRSTADVFKYFDDAEILYENFKDDPVVYLQMLSGINDDSELHRAVYEDSCKYWVKAFDYRLFNDNRTIIRFNALLFPFSGGNIYSHSVIMAFLSFLGGYLLFLFFHRKIEINKIVLYFSVFCIPSFLIWTSGLLKEGLVMAGLGLFLFQLQKSVERFSLLRLFQILLSILILALTKYYVLFVIIPASVSYVFACKNGKILKSFIVIHCISFTFLLMNYYVFQIFPFFETIATKQNDFIKMSEALGNVGSFMDVPFLEGTPFEFLKAIPQAIYASFFRPTLWEVHNFLALIPAFENMVILLLLILMVKYRDKNKHFSPEILLSISFVILLFILSGLATPVIGALVRYKAPGLPFLTISVLWYIDLQKIPFLKNLPNIRARAKKLGS